MWEIEGAECLAKSTISFECTTTMVSSLLLAYVTSISTLNPTTVNDPRETIRV